MNGLFIGDCPNFVALRARLDRVAPTSLPVLIRGETGTGKEVAARYLHAHSAQADGPFIAVDCAAIAEDLLESELFGHERGAFTGAQHAKSGLVHAAHNGTFFLDEVADLSLNAQTRLLRLLEEGRYRPVGSSVEREAKVRVIAATWVDLHEAVQLGRFRRDLYHRLAVVEEVLPPLRDRHADIHMLTAHFLATISKRQGTLCPQPSPELTQHLSQLPWPGNIRELRNTLEYLVALCSGSQLQISDLPARLKMPPLPIRQPIVRTDLPYLAARRLCLERFQREYVRQLLVLTDGNISEAARLAQMDRRSIQRILKRTRCADDSAKIR